MIAEKTLELLEPILELASADNLERDATIDKVLELSRAVCVDINAQADELALGDGAKADEIRRLSQECIDAIDDTLVRDV